MQKACQFVTFCLSFPSIYFYAIITIRNVTGSCSLLLLVFVAIWLMFNAAIDAVAVAAAMLFATLFVFIPYVFNSSFIVI